MSIARASLRLSLLGSVLALGALAPAAGLEAQETPAAVTVTGVVVDAGTGTPIPGAAVFPMDRAGAVFADTRGNFTVREARPGALQLMVAQLGYDTLRVEVPVAEGSGPVTLRLEPDPVALERVTALVDRFEERRRSVAESVRSFDQARLRNTGALDVLEFVRSRANVRPVRCPSRIALAPCAAVRGRPVEVQVFLDGSRIISGLDLLATLRPEEIYTLEVIGGGRVIRAYTNWYVETAAAGRPIPVEIFF